MEQIGVGIEPSADQPFDELQEEAAVRLHGTGNIEEHDQPHGPLRWGGMHERDRFAAMPEICPDHPAHIEAAAALVRAVTPGQPMPHGPCKSERQSLGLGNLVRIDELAQVGLRTRGAVGGDNTARCVARDVALAIAGRFRHAVALAFSEMLLPHTSAGRIGPDLGMGQGVVLRPLAPPSVPVGLEEVVEPDPFVTPTGEQHLQAAVSLIGRDEIGPGQEFDGRPCLGDADGEVVHPQVVNKTENARGDRCVGRCHLLTLPDPRAATSLRT